MWANGWWAPSLNINFWTCWSVCLIEMFGYFSFRAKTQKLMNFERCLLFPPVYCLLYFDYPLFLKTSNTKCILKLLNVSSIPVCEHSPVNKCIYTLCRLIFVAWNFFQEKTIWMIKNVYSSFLFFCFSVVFFFFFNFSCQIHNYLRLVTQMKNMCICVEHFILPKILRIFPNIWLS